MRALVISDGAPERLALADVDEPVAIGDHAVVAVEAFSLNRGETRLVGNRPSGWRPGQDVAGVVAVAAPDGSGPAAGQRVVGMPDDGGWAERVAVPTSRLAVLPDPVDARAACTLPIAGLTALRAVRLGGSLLGRRVLVTGATGGVGRFGVELAAGAGAVVTAVARRGRGRDLVDLGAAEVVASVAEGTGPFHLVLESAGGSSLSEAVSVAAPGGTIAVYGSSSTEPATIGFADFRGRGALRIESFFLFQSGEPFGPDLQVLVDLTAAERLHPQIGFTAGWDDVGEALRRLRDREIDGKAVLHVG